jgi:hypothetical protein
MQSQMDKISNAPLEHPLAIIQNSIQTKNREWFYFNKLIYQILDSESYGKKISVTYGSRDEMYKMLISSQQVIGECTTDIVVSFKPETGYADISLTTEGKSHSFKVMLIDEIRWEFLKIMREKYPDI